MDPNHFNFDNSSLRLGSASQLFFVKYYLERIAEEVQVGVRQGLSTSQVSRRVEHVVKIVRPSID